MSASESPLLTAFREGFERYAAIFSAGDFELASAFLSDDVVQHFPEGFPERSISGRQAWVRFFEEFRRDLGTWRMTLVECFDAGPGQIIGHLEHVGIGRSSELRTTFKTWGLIEFDEHGRVRLVRNLADRDEAVAAAAAARAAREASRG